MNENIKLAINYFSAPVNYFWNWAERGEVIEWQNGSTICYRDELMDILRGLSEQGLPSLGTLLLTFAACQENWKESTASRFIFSGLYYEMIEEAADPSDEALDYYIHQALQCMDIIHELPKDLRSGKNVIHLFHEIYAKGVCEVPASQARGVIDEFSSGRLDSQVLRSGKEISRAQFMADLVYLNNALKAFPDKSSLETKLRTGLKNIPEKAEVNLPEPEPLDLLEQLAEDTRTAGISRLTKRLLAALHIPMHSQGSSHLPYGGISDVTNRGNFDRLLLSELAQDDELLTARLVNNEALYLRREEPPDTLNRQRTILLDSTIKMWGTPRVFAISAALACAQPAKHIAESNAYALGGNTFEQIDLTSKNGIMATLERLDPALDCGKALLSWMEEQQHHHLHEYILISDEQFLHHPESGRMLSALKHPLSFIITVNRKGDLGFYEYIHGRTKLLNKAKFDLGELLHAPPRSFQRKGTDILPAFIKREVSPLYFPTSGMRLSEKNTFHYRDFGVVGVTENQRVLYWPMKVLGARELLPFIEPGAYYFGFDGIVTLFILVNNPTHKRLLFYKIHTVKNTVETKDLSTDIPAVGEALFHANLFFICTATGVVLFDCVNGEIDTHQDKGTAMQLFTKYKSQRIPSDFSYLKRYINNGYSVLQRVQHIAVNAYKHLSLDGYDIALLNNNHLKLIDNRKKAVLHRSARHEAQPLEQSTILPHTNIRLNKWVWSDGSEAVVDSRGLLHLRSSDPAIPEITIVLALGKPSACWAADGKMSGSFYFTGADPSESMPAALFYTTYIQRFIDRLP